MRRCIAISGSDHAIDELAGEKSQSILVIDDDEAFRALARISLENVGLAVWEAGTGGEAHACVRSCFPDLILLDATLPDCSGFDLCGELRKMEGLEGVPIVMITGHDDVESVRRSYEMGATDFVAKPLRWLILVQRVLSLLRASRNLDELRESRRQLAYAQRIAQLGSWRYDPWLDRLWVSDEARRVLEGLPAGEVSVEDVMALVHDDDTASVRAALEGGTDGSAFLSFDFRVMNTDGAERNLRASAESIPGDLSLSGIVQDITKQVHAEEQIRFLAYHDSLTKLGNRLSFKERLSGAIDRARRVGHGVGVIFLDLDGFKRVNDTYGHEVGDQLLCAVADRLRGSVRKTDSVLLGADSELASFIARLGGDEFTIVLEDIREPADVKIVAERITEILRKPIAVGPHELTATASMGLATWPADGDDMETLLRKTDVAMYQAKGEGPGKFRFYSESMSATTRRQVELETKLRRSLEEEDFELHFQPLARASDKTVVGVEALLRWSPEGEAPVGPSEFIPIAEDIGVISQLGEWVLRSACREAARWREAGHPVPVWVNLSARQIHTGLPGIVRRSLDAAGLSAKDLVLEITESVLMRDEASVLPVLNEIREMGAGLALDDFGTGYSSLSYLRRYPIDRLKIDRSFVSDLEFDAGDRRLLRAIVLMAKALDLQVVAEGVETPWQRRFLQEEGCDLLQGFLLGRPVSAKRIEGLLRR